MFADPGRETAKLFLHIRSYAIKYNLPLPEFIVTPEWKYWLRYVIEDINATVPSNIPTCGEYMGIKLHWERR